MSGLPHIYRDLNQQELDVQYNAQATVGDISPFVAAYKDQSAEARNALEYLDSLSFGPSAEETLDLFPASKNAPSSNSIISATEVIGFVIEAIRNIVSFDIFVWESTSWYPFSLK